MTEINNLLFRHGDFSLSLAKAENRGPGEDKGQNGEAQFVLTLAKNSTELCEIQLQVEQENSVSVLTAKRVDKPILENSSGAVDSAPESAGLPQVPESTKSHESSLDPGISQNLSKIRIDRKIEAYSRKKRNKEVETWSNIYETIYVSQPSGNGVRNVSKAKYEKVLEDSGEKLTVIASNPDRDEDYVTEGESLLSESKSHDSLSSFVISDIKVSPRFPQRENFQVEIDEIIQYHHTQETT